MPQSRRRGGGVRSWVWAAAHALPAARAQSGLPPEPRAQETSPTTPPPSSPRPLGPRPACGPAPRLLPAPRSRRVAAAAAPGPGSLRQEGGWRRKRPSTRPPQQTSRRRLPGLVAPRRRSRGGPRGEEAAGARGGGGAAGRGCRFVVRGPGRGSRSGRRGELCVPLPPRLMATALGTSGTLRPWRPRRGLFGPRPRPLW